MFRHRPVSPVSFWAEWKEGDAEFVTVSHAESGSVITVRKADVTGVVVGDGFGAIITTGGDELHFDSLPVWVDEVDNVVYLEDTE